MVYPISWIYGKKMYTTHIGIPHECGTIDHERVQNACSRPPSGICLSKDKESCLWGTAACASMVATSPEKNRVPQINPIQELWLKIAFIPTGHWFKPGEPGSFQRLLVLQDHPNPPRRCASTARRPPTSPGPRRCFVLFRSINVTKKPYQLRCPT